MYKIMIVDDEPATRFTIMKLIGSFKGPYQVVGEAINGLQGLYLIEEKQPDIVILDIMMPEIDGITLLGKIRERQWNCQVIILSAYDDFKYVRQSFQLDALDFLLKPVRREELKEMLEKAVFVLDLESTERERQLSVHHLLDKSLHAYREVILKQLIEQSGYDKVAADMPGILGDGLQRFGVVVFDLNEEQEKRDLLSELKRFVEDRASRLSVQSAFFDKDNKLVLIHGFDAADQHRDPEKFLHETARFIQDGFYMERQLLVPAGVGQLAIHPREIQKSYSGACIALDYRFSTLGQTVFVVGECQSTQKKSAYPYVLENAFLAALALLDEEATVKHLDAFFKEIMSQRLYPTSLKQLCMQFGLSFLKHIKTLPSASDPDMNDAMFFDMNRYEHIGDFRMQMTWVAANMISVLSESKHTTQEGGFKQRVDQYLENHYNKNIGLLDIAEEYGLSTNYFCSLFKKELGMNFVEYVTNFRMELAKRLLLDYELQISEIAEKVGYSDARYFFRVFKKQEGLTPSEYRQTHMRIS